MPDTLIFEGDNSITYAYTADGAKLQKTVHDNSSTTTTAYDHGFIYKNGTLKFFAQPEGYVEPNGNSGFTYVYQYKDQLGNIRLSYKNTGSASHHQLSIVEENNYYPFGLKHQGYNNVVSGNEYKYKTYQGQELNDELGLNWLSFKYRNYDAAIGRFMSVDPSATKYPYNGVYNFSENRVVDAWEIEGLEAQPIYDNHFDLTKEKTRGDIQMMKKVMPALKQELHKLGTSFSKAFYNFNSADGIRISSNTVSGGENMGTTKGKHGVPVNVDALVENMLGQGPSNPSKLIKWREVGKAIVVPFANNVSNSSSIMGPPNLRQNNNTKSHVIYIQDHVVFSVSTLGQNAPVFHRQETSIFKTLYNSKARADSAINAIKQDSLKYLRLLQIERQKYENKK